jgi:hypothetical protein
LPSILILAKTLSPLNIEHNYTIVII